MKRRYEITDQINLYQQQAERIIQIKEISFIFYIFELKFIYIGL